MLGENSDNVLTRALLKGPQSESNKQIVKYRRLSLLSSTRQLRTITAGHPENVLVSSFIEQLFYSIFRLLDGRCSSSLEDSDCSGS